MKRKRINKRLLYVILSIIIVSVLSLTIAYSVLSSNLTISGSTEVSGSSWNISVSKYDILSAGNTTKEEMEEISNILGWKFFYNGYSIEGADLIREPIIDGTSINNMHVSLTIPGAMIMLIYKVTNNGTIPAKYESIIKNTLSFSSSTNNSADLELVFNNVYNDFELFYTTDLTSDNIISVGHVLCPGETVYLAHGVAMKDTATSVPSSDITVSNLGGTINFVQADKSSCS